MCHGETECFALAFVELFKRSHIVIQTMQKTKKNSGNLLVYNCRNMESGDWLKLMA